MAARSAVPNGAGRLPSHLQGEPPLPCTPPRSVTGSARRAHLVSAGEVGGRLRLAARAAPPVPLTLRHVLRARPAVGLGGGVEWAVAVVIGELVAARPAGEHLVRYDGFPVGDGVGVGLHPMSLGQLLAIYRDDPL